MSSDGERIAYRPPLWSGSRRFHPRVELGRMDMVAFNALARALFAPLFDSETTNARGRPNFARYSFLDRGAPDFAGDWDLAANTTAALLRLTGTHLPAAGPAHLGPRGSFPDPLHRRAGHPRRRPAHAPGQLGSHACRTPEPVRRPRWAQGERHRHPRSPPVGPRHNAGRRRPGPGRARADSPRHGPTAHHRWP